MARAQYIYTVTIDSAVVWIGTVKHEMRSFLYEGTRYPVSALVVHRRRAGSQEGSADTWAMIPAPVFLATGKIG